MDSHSRQASARGCDSQQESSPGRQKIKHLGLLCPAAVSMFRKTLDEPADTPVETDQCPCCLPTAGYVCNHVELELHPLNSRGPIDEESRNVSDDKAHVHQDDEHSYTTQGHLPNTYYYRCSHVNDVFVAAHIEPSCNALVLPTDTEPSCAELVLPTGKETSCTTLVLPTGKETSCTTLVLPTGTDPNGSPSALTEQVLCDKVTKLHYNTHTTHTDNTHTTHTDNSHTTHTNTHTTHTDNSHTTHTDNTHTTHTDNTHTTHTDNSHTTHTDNTHTTHTDNSHTTHTDNTHITHIDNIHTTHAETEKMNEDIQVTTCSSSVKHYQKRYYSNSPTLNLTLHGSHPQPASHHIHHQENNNHCRKETYFLGSPRHTSTSGCSIFTQGRAADRPNMSDGLGNGWIPTDISEDNDPLLQLQDSMSAPPMQDSMSVPPMQDSMSAPPMQDKYQYHVFFSHCPQDREWVEHLVEHLEAPPYNYVCAYTSLHNDTDSRSLQQSVLCAAMLSQQLVLVLSKHYIQLMWDSFEKTLKQLTQMSLHKEKILAVLLEDCHIPDSMENFHFLDACASDFFLIFTKRLKSRDWLHSSTSISSDLGQQEMPVFNVSNGTILSVCRLHVQVGWNSYLVPVDGSCLDTDPSLSTHGIGMEKTEFTDIVSKVAGIVNSCNKLPWILSAQPLAALVLAALFWLPAFIAILVIHVEDDSGIALPVRLTVFLFPLGLVAGGYLIKWRQSYWMTKVVRLLIQNCVDVNQAFYFQGRPVFVTAAYLKTNMFSIYFVYFDATDCVRDVDLLLWTCMENDWDKLVKLITFYTRDENYLSRMSLSERLTVMMSAPYLVKLVKQMLPQPPQQRHVSRLLCLCQFTEECISRFAHGLEREDVPGLAELFVRHMPGRVSGSAVRRVQEELFHASHGLVH